MNAQTFNALLSQQVPRLTLRQRELLKKRLDELDEQQKGLAVIESSSPTEPRCCPHCQVQRALPAWPRQWLAALPLPGMPPYVQCPDGHRAGAAAQERQVVRF